MLLKRWKLLSASVFKGYKYIAKEKTVIRYDLGNSSNFDSFYQKQIFL